MNFVIPVSVETSSKLGREGSGRNPARMVCLAEGTVHVESSGELSITVLSPWYGFSHAPPCSQLHWFGDASEKAFCAVAYFRFEYPGGETVRLCSILQMIAKSWPEDRCNYSKLSLVKWTRIFSVVRRSAA